MAAALIPLIPAAVSILTPLVKSLIVHAEQQFGPKTGQTKAALVASQVLPAVEQLAAAGKIPGTLDGQSISTIIETVFQGMKAAGEIPAAGAVLPAQAGQSYTFAGTLTLPAAAIKPAS